MEHVASEIYADNYIAPEPIGFERLYIERVILPQLCGEYGKCETLLYDSSEEE